MLAAGRFRAVLGVTAGDERIRHDVTRVTRAVDSVTRRCSEQVRWSDDYPRVRLRTDPYTQVQHVRNTIKSLTGLFGALAALAGLCAAVPAIAGDYEVPPQLQVSILLKVLVYDRSLATRSRDGLSLAIVYDSHNDASRSCKDGFAAAFKESPRQLAGTTIALMEIGQDQLAAEADKGLDIVYLCNGTKTEKVLEIAKKKMLITFAPDELAVQQGVAIGLIPRDGKPKTNCLASGSVTAKAPSSNSGVGAGDVSTSRRARNASSCAELSSAMALKGWPLGGPFPIRRRRWGPLSRIRSPSRRVGIMPIASR